MQKARSTPFGARTSPKSSQWTPTSHELTAHLRPAVPSYPGSCRPLLSLRGRNASRQEVPHTPVSSDNHRRGRRNRLEAARKLCSNGFVVYAGARRVDRMEPLKVLGV